MAKILIYSPNLISKSMAGAAIRSWEFAKNLSINHQVTLISKEPPEVRSHEFAMISLKDPRCKAYFQKAHLLITQRLTLPLALWASSYGIKVIIDAYDPSPLELLEFYKKGPQARKDKKIRSQITNLIFSFKMADGIICASERQRALWTGFLLGQKLITPQVYERDPTLRSFIGIVPFGLSDIPPQKNGKGLKERLGLDPQDIVLLWGGGLWNWFDPLSLIKAMQIISQKRADIKLVFMGIKPPDPDLPTMSMALESVQLAKKLGLLDKSVFFHYEWIPYEERQNFLLDSDIGVSMHFDHLETHFSFRTRILDYLWAELPIITTSGDLFADLVHNNHLGLVVPPKDEQAIADAVFSLTSHREKFLQIKKNLKAIQEQFYWKSTMIPLQKMIEELAPYQKPKGIWRRMPTLMNFLITKALEKM